MGWCPGAPTRHPWGSRTRKGLTWPLVCTGQARLVSGTDRERHLPGPGGAEPGVRSPQECRPRRRQWGTRRPSGREGLLPAQNREGGLAGTSTPPNLQPRSLGKGDTGHPATTENLLRVLAVCLPQCERTHVGLRCSQPVGAEATPGAWRPWGRPLTAPGRPLCRPAQGRHRSPQPLCLDLWTRTSSRALRSWTRGCPGPQRGPGHTHNGHRGRREPHWGV